MAQAEATLDPSQSFFALDSMSDVVAQRTRPATEEKARPPPKKRRRIVISCTECHRRKQKCDRKLPCTNCVTRNKQDCCRYETLAPTSKLQRRNSSKTDGEDGTNQEIPHDSLQSKATDFGYSQAGANTLGFLERIDHNSRGMPLGRLSEASLPSGSHVPVREKYRAFIRQLPARQYIDKLVNVYFTEINFLYFVLDPDIFAAQLAEWFSLPFSVFTTEGPQHLDPEMRAFPALLFQVLAMALVVLPEELHADCDQLKYTSKMNLEDLAVDYSESGMGIVALLGKRQMSVNTVLTGMTRAAFFKYMSLITESWHTLGSAIRDAQEIGLHDDSRNPQPKGTDAGAILENQWEIQRRRKIWCILLLWDTNMAVVLGRPISVSRDIEMKLPVDSPLPKDKAREPVLPRTEDEMPTPLSRLLWSLNYVSILRDILDLEKDGPCPKNYDRVDKIHWGLVEMNACMPAYLRFDNHDPRFDELRECSWMQYMRIAQPQSLYFSLMALHRPYVFTRPRSRTEALKASMAMLASQRDHFNSLDACHYRTFTLFFGTFDAVVLLSSIYILFPKEHPELAGEAAQQFIWSIERFEQMSTRNHMAKTALGVLYAISGRLEKVLPLSSVGNSFPTPALTVDQGNIDPTLTNGSYEAALKPDIINGGFPPTTGETMDPYLPTPNGFDWSSIPPVFATSDLAYHDLSCIPANDICPTDGGGVINSPSSLVFEGDFCPNSLWSILNQLSSTTSK